MKNSSLVHSIGDKNQEVLQKLGKEIAEIRNYRIDET